ncbi:MULTISPECIES: DUF4260 domain-containing protein [Halolamina]|uniref:DUF4260 domain-containing protein n=1 Tax=Halolamina pelagica TaxID=699431 RepID=A0A1I5Q3J7_9EURY|nr:MULTISPECIES: DUF4260 domain-containing protein [Halolamina]NHX35073.1 DUF4260 domain-containing protein [Halolamina sp. R1-12]SFP40600.1 protein of unknown function [Halolamina pelagica]
MEPRTVLRLEGVAVFLAATAAYFAVDGPLWLFLVLALAPDLSMLGYLAGDGLGSRVYNAFHAYVGPTALGAAGIGLDVPAATWVALVWAAHVGADRAAGYGLKYSTGFKHTHLAAPDGSVVDSADPAEVFEAEAVDGR